MSTREIVFPEVDMKLLGNIIKFIQCPECYAIIGIDFNGLAVSDRWKHMQKVHGIAEKI